MCVVLPVSVHATITFEERNRETDRQTDRDLHRTVDHSDHLIHMEQSDLTPSHTNSNDTADLPNTCVINVTVAMVM